MVGQTRIRIRRPALLRLLRRLSTSSPFELMCGTRTFFRVIGVAVGIGVSSSSTLAEVEEAVSQDGSKSDYSDSALSHNLIVNLLVNNIENQLDEYSTKPNILNSGTDLILHNSFGDVFIPAAVWGLDVSAGAHLDRGSSEIGSESDAALGGRQKNADFWTAVVPNLLIDNNTDMTSDVSQFLPLSLQVASCGGNAVEHGDLDYCNSSSAELFDNSGRVNNNGTVSVQNTSSNVTSSGTFSAYNLENQSNTAPITPLAPITPPIVNNLVPQGNVIDLSALSEPCDDISASCGTIAINPPTTPTDPPTTPIDYPTTPPDLQPTGDPGPTPQPTFTPPPVASTVPETSTWIMTIVGFGIIALASRGRALHPIKHSVVGTFHRLFKKSLPNDTA